MCKYTQQRKHWSPIKKLRLVLISMYFSWLKCVCWTTSFTKPLIIVSSTFQWRDRMVGILQMTFELDIFKANVYSWLNFILWFGKPYKRWIRYSLLTRICVNTHHRVSTPTFGVEVLYQESILLDKKKYFEIKLNKLCSSWTHGMALLSALLILFYGNAAVMKALLTHPPNPPVPHICINEPGQHSSR